MASTKQDPGNEIFDDLDQNEQLLDGQTDGLRHSKTSNRINGSEKGGRQEKTGGFDEIKNKEAADDVVTKVVDMTMWQSCMVVVKLAVPPIISSFFYMFVQLVNTYFVGHLNDAVLIAGVGMGNMLINVLFFAVA
jgi:hypothetical protein